MESMRVGGLASGLDTNAIIDNLMTTAKEPINRMNEKVNLLTWEQTQYNDILSALSDLKSAMLPLKMESTFKSKLATSTSSGVAEAVASINTPPGSYTVKVDQTAEPSYAVSTYTSYSMISAGGGVKGLSSVTKYKYNQIEGQHKVTITNPNSTTWIAKDTFTAKSNQKFNKMTASTMDGSLVDNNGKLRNAVDETLSLVFTYEGEAKSVDLNLKYDSGTYTTTIAQDLEQRINAVIDKNLGKNGAQSVAVRVERDETTGAFSFAFYDTTNSSKIDIIGFRDPNYDPANPGATDGTGATSLAKKLGVYYNQDISLPEATTEMTNTVISNSAENLLKKINKADGGLIMGAVFSADAAGLSAGTFSVNQDSTANNKAATKSSFTGDTFSGLAAATDDEIDAWMKSALSATDSNDSSGNPYTRNFFDTKPSESTNGFFHINGVRIDIYDYRTLTPERLIGLINGSGAGVTASFDREAGVFKVESNKTGSGDVTMGQDGDTSDILSVMKLTIPSGATYMRGKTEGTVDTSAKLSGTDSGLTMSVTSGIFTINGVSIYLDNTTDTIDSVMKKINQSGAGVTISYDSTTDKFSMSGTGMDRIKLGSANDSSNFLEAINLTYNAYEEIEAGTEGKKAVFTINGTKYERESNEIKDAVAGMTINLMDKGTTVINVKVDTDKAVDAMASFAAKYNELINKLSPTEPTKQDREKYADPLSDDDKKEMSEDDIKNYEKNYNRIQYYDMVMKSSELRYLKMNVRDNIMKEVTLPDNKFGSLAELGVNIAGSDTQNISITKIGLLFDVSTDKDELAKYIKENTKFASNVANYSDDMYKFFTESKEVKVSKSTGKVITDSNSREEYTTVTYTGWAKRYDTMLVNNTSTTSALYKKAGTNGTLDTKISNLKKQIDVQTTRAENYLERMWAQFSAMEQRVQNMQAQASYLTQISGGSSS